MRTNMGFWKDYIVPVEGHQLEVLLKRARLRNSSREERLETYANLHRTAMINRILSSSHTPGRGGDESKDCHHASAPDSALMTESTVGTEANIPPGPIYSIFPTAREEWSHEPYCGYLPTGYKGDISRSSDSIKTDPPFFPSTIADWETEVENSTLFLVDLHHECVHEGIDSLTREAVNSVQQEDSAQNLHVGDSFLMEIDISRENLPIISPPAQFADNTSTNPHREETVSASSSSRHKENAEDSSNDITWRILAELNTFRSASSDTIASRIAAQYTDYSRAEIDRLIKVSVATRHLIFDRLKMLLAKADLCDENARIAVAMIRREINSFIE
jgi:hypothetical protein